MTTTPSEKDLVSPDTLRECASIIAERHPWCANHFILAAIEITRLRERCEAYKGQVKFGSEVIDRLRATSPAVDGDVVERICAHIVDWAKQPGHQYLEYATASDLAHSLAGLLKGAEGSGDAGKETLLEAVERKSREPVPGRALPASAPAPEWQTVPKKPTEDMCDAAECAFSTEAMWEAFLNAAPIPPAHRAGAGQLDRAPDGVEAMRKKILASTPQKPKFHLREEGYATGWVDGIAAYRQMIRALPLSPQAAGEEKQ